MIADQAVFNQNTSDRPMMAHINNKMFFKLRNLQKFCYRHSFRKLRNCLVIQFAFHILKIEKTTTRTDHKNVALPLEGTYSPAFSLSSMPVNRAEVTLLEDRALNHMEVT